jgi:putative membrane protein
MAKLIFIVLALIAAAIGLVLGTLNADPVVVDLLWFQLNWPLGLVLVSTLALGVLIGIAGTWILQVWPARLALRQARAVADRASAPLSVPEAGDD